MMATSDSFELKTTPAETADDGRAEVAVESTRASAHGEERPLPRIGALPNPRIGPMVVINDGGYLAPFWSAGELLRGGRYFWRA